MKTKWLIIGVVSFIAIILFGSGAAPLIFSEVVYGCNLQRMLATGDVEQVSDHPITMAYHEKYKFDSSHTSRSRSLEWGYGTVEYYSYYETKDHGWANAHLKVIVDPCSVPVEFQFQCIDSEDKAWVSLNSKKDNLIDYLQYENCF